MSVPCHLDSFQLSDFTDQRYIGTVSRRLTGDKGETFVRFNFRCKIVVTIKKKRGLRRFLPAG